MIVDCYIRANTENRGIEKDLQQIASVIKLAKVSAKVIGQCERI